tara:strand:+ start:787 stop:1020 length:234 start_codon:yes stop_codon:yes gene_type:complete
MQGLNIIITMGNKNVYDIIETGDLVMTQSGDVGLVIEVTCALEGRLKRIFFDPYVYHVLVGNECITVIREVINKVSI